MEILVHCINSFTHNGAGGNPAGVVLNADELTATQMQLVASNVGFSETAFVSKGTDCDFTVRFFTPNEEVDFCGHATLATFSLMYNQNVIEDKRYTQQTKAGQLNVSILSDGTVTMQQTLPKYLGTIDSGEVANILNIDVDTFKQTNLPCEIISTGLPDVIVPIPYGHLDKIEPNDEDIATFSQKYNVIGLHLFELSDESSNITASCRNFAPLFGIPEESATGSASGALACYLTQYNVTPTRIYNFEQGKTMSSPSRLLAKITETEHEITQVEVSGKARLFETRTVTFT